LFINLKHLVKIFVILPLKGAWARDMKSRSEGSEKLLIKQMEKGAGVSTGDKVAGIQF
jgi:hypothetical protein